ncbi:hypothetical protein BaRGS_00005241 [Batillaria attramentaria]|uniref:Uncharacterized protein n=1 Tax=Batillaria attramentaria TaxID=370345 RepID=A0ABD0LW03_9CAEN
MPVCYRCTCADDNHARLRRNKMSAVSSARGKRSDVRVSQNTWQRWKSLKETNIHNCREVCHNNYGLVHTNHVSLRSPIDPSVHGESVPLYLATPGAERGSIHWLYDSCDFDTVIGSRLRRGWLVFGAD